MKSHLGIFLVGLVSLLAAGAVTHTEDSLDKVRKNLGEEKAIIIDVREQGEWKRGHLKEAQLVPLSELRKIKKDSAVREKVEKTLPKDQIIYCHCGSGVRVLSAAAILGDLGYDIRPLASGFDDLREAGFPLAEEP